MDELISRNSVEHLVMTKSYDLGEPIQKRLMLHDVEKLPYAEPEIIYCKDCRWWDREAEDSPMGYCHACKHSHYSRHWEINIRRTYEEDVCCSDADPKEEGE